MKFSGASFAAILAAGLASAQAPAFTVSKFSAGATPHSSIGYVELTFAAGAKETTCKAQPPTYQSFPSIEKTACSEPGMAFSLTKRADGGSDLELFSGAASAIHTIKKEEISEANQQSPTGTVQVYSGPQSFTAEPANGA